jgi:hypothetical protein
MYSNMLVVKSNDNTVTLFECLSPYLKQESFLDSFNFKFPMFIIAFILVVGYQIYKNKFNNKSSIADDGSLLS